MKNINLVTEPIAITWGFYQDVGNWDMIFPTDSICRSLEEQKKSYTEIILKTLDAFDSFARVNTFVILPVFKKQSVTSYIEWAKEENYQDYIRRCLETLATYPIEIDEIEISVDLNVFVYTKKSPNVPVRCWVRRHIDDSIEMGRFDVYAELGEEPAICFDIQHTLFHPYIYEEDNSELFKLNQPLLETALKNWEAKFNVEIEAGGLDGTYKYGFLPDYY